MLQRLGRCVQAYRAAYVQPTGLTRCEKATRIVVDYCIFKVRKIRQFTASIGCGSAKGFPASAPDPLKRALVRRTILHCCRGGANSLHVHRPTCRSNAWRLSCLRSDHWSSIARLSITSPCTCCKNQNRKYLANT